MKPTNTIFSSKATSLNKAATKIEDHEATSYNARINVIRFFAIASVVWGHCLLGLENKSFSGANYQIAQAVLIQAGRVGTIMFFVISGFFLEDKISGFTPLAYLKYRFRSLIMPWAIFVLLITLVQLLNQFSYKEMVTFTPERIWFILLTMASGNIFHAAYWFVPVTIFSSVILIYLKNFVHTWWLPLALAGISLFYSINLYAAWIPVAHTKAFMGYIFYVWVGMQVKVNIVYVKTILNKISGVLLFLVTFTVFLFACKEGVHLTRLGCADAFASLRVSNAVLSMLIFTALLKTHRLTFVMRFRPQRKSFGLYLVHTFIIMLVSPVAVEFVQVQGLSFSLLALALIQLAFFLIVFSLAYATVYVLRRSVLSFMIGVRSVREQIRDGDSRDLSNRNRHLVIE